MDNPVISQALMRLRAAADAIALPTIRWTRIAGPGPDTLDQDGSGTFAGLVFQPGQDLTIATRLILPAQVAGVPLVGDPLEATIASLYPTQITWDEEPVFAEDGIPVAAGPALVTVIPALREGENGELRIVVRIPNNQTTPWFTVRFTTPGLRARFELLDVAWAELAWAQALAVTEEEQAVVVRAAALVPTDLAAFGAETLHHMEDELALLASKAAAHKVHIIGHSHIDMNWLWTWDDTNNVIYRDFKSVVELMDDYPELTFTHSQPATYETIRQQTPDLFARVVALIKQGRWEPATLTWVEGDTNMASGEAMARQLLEAVRYSRQLLGAEPTTFLAPDTFGHAGNLPQLAVSAGAARYYHHRCNPGQADLWPAYWWEGQDGTRLLRSPPPPTTATSAPVTWSPPPSMPASMAWATACIFMVSATTAAARHARTWMPCAASSSARCCPPASAAHWPAIPNGCLRQVRPCRSSAASRARSSRAATPPTATSNGTTATAKICSAPPTPWQHWPVLSRHAPAGLANAALQPVPRHLGWLRDSRDLYQVCDRFCGNHGGSQRGDGISTGCAAARLPAGSVAVANPLGWERQDWVCVPGMTGAGSVLLVGSHGQRAVGQYTPAGLGFVARVPAFGTVSYRVEASDPAEDGSLVADLAFAPTDNREFNLLSDNRQEPPYYKIETSFFRVYLRRDSGILVSFYDKRVGRELVGFGMRRGSDYTDSARADLALNVLQLEEKHPHPMTAWHLDEVQPPQPAAWRNHPTGRSRSGAAGLLCPAPGSRFDHPAIHHLLSRSPRVDFRTQVDWQELGSPAAGVPNLKVAFTARLPECQAWFETPFAAVQRPCDGQEVPALRWADVGGAAYGMALLNDSKYGYDALGTGCA